jgi:hypothetical protein
MTLRFGDHFGSRAGSTWHLVFVYTLFPWLNQYRILREDERSVLELSKSFALQRSYTEAEKEVDKLSNPPSSMMMQRRSSIWRLSGNGALLSGEIGAKSSVWRASAGRPSLLVGEIGDLTVIELEDERNDLQEQVANLERENTSMKDENERLRALLSEHGVQYSVP